MKTKFINAEQSHQHSLQTLEQIYEYDDFMLSIEAVADMGCGDGLDIEWWATRTTRDDNPKPLNLKCTGFDLRDRLNLSQRYNNLQYQIQNFDDPIAVYKKTFDVVWCHDAFQYSINPLATLVNWNKIMNPNGMLALILPQTTNLEFNVQAFDQEDGCYYNWTTISLIHALAVSGFDCRDGFFKKMPGDPWLHAVVYKSEHAPMDPRTTKWYDLIDRGLIPDSLAAGILRHGHARQRDLILPWIDKSLHSFAQQ